MHYMFAVNVGVGGGWICEKLQTLVQTRAGPQRHGQRGVDWHPSHLLTLAPCHKNKHLLSSCQGNETVVFFYRLHVIVTRKKLWRGLSKCCPCGFCRRSVTNYIQIWTSSYAHNSILNHQNSLVILMYNLINLILRMIMNMN